MYFGYILVNGGYSNNGIAKLIRKHYKPRWGEFVLDLLYSLPWLKRPPRDPLMDVSLRSIFEANVNTEELELKLGASKLKSMATFDASNRLSRSQVLPNRQKNEPLRLEYNDYMIDQDESDSDGDIDGESDDNPDLSFDMSSTVEWFFRQVCLCVVFFIVVMTTTMVCHFALLFWSLFVLDNKTKINSNCYYILCICSWI